ncbi:hypothetical protein COV82_01190 [Candidatus Peregrinibacteria bacterium CG11_big_fil_rev_8_21_14_0_20_46_8]|nr:MAG: hypothetical protein COV82_01190 [Candidatus Peregrinibacteria bacterium CG11_big_fil_rev_8_21_14_0_20_46_8]
MAQKQIKKYIRYIAWAVALLAAGALVYYSIVQYRAGDAQEGIVVCSEEVCYKTVHIHADIDFDLCDTAYVLPRETGPLQSVHTHKEKNFLHFHDKIELDVLTKEQKSDVRLSMENVLQTFELTPQKFCGTADVQILITVNGREENLAYEWRDGDDITIQFKK